MVQILPAVERRLSFGESLGTVVGEGLKAYGEHQKKKRYGEALRGLTGN